MATRTLFEISKAYQNIWDLVLDFDGNDLDAIENGLKSIEGEVEDKCRNGIGLIRSLNNLAEGMKYEAERLTVRRKAIENRISRIKEWYFDNLDKMGIQKVPTSLGTMSICKAGGNQGIDITNEEEVIKAGYCEVIPEKTVVDKDKVRAALEKGEEVKGAHLKPRGRYLKIS
ncbi:MAG: siphovirus Gp157 family protein [Selenomonadaceae bacterium]|nr:siphovirus Gp157 family protein [Selenomonadaceae bacterium]